MRNYSLLFILSLAALNLTGQKASVAELLGHPANSKLLIIHADDLGVSHSQNAASIKALESSPVNSASIMVPCPWFPEIAAYARKHQDTDLGLHLTLTSEWKHYKWGPVTSRDSVPGLVNREGYFYSAVDSLVNSASREEVELELRNQVKKAYQVGVNVTHLDAHMGAAVSTPDYLAAYMKVGQEFRLPVLLDGRVNSIELNEVKQMIGDQTVVVSGIPTILPDEFKKGSREFYTNLFRNLKPGLHCLLIHLAYDNEEMKAVTIDHPEWGSAWRQADYDFFTSPECAQLLKDHNIITVTWRELRDKVVRLEK